MRMICVHFDHRIIVSRQSPLECGNVSRTKAKLAFAFEQENASGRRRHALLDQLSRTVFAVVVDKENVRFRGMLGDAVEQRLDIAFFVVGRNDYKALAKSDGGTLCQASSLRYDLP